MESLVISLLLFGVLVFLAWVFVKGIANMEPAGAAAGGFMILILIPVFIIVLIVFLWYTISSGGGLYLVLAILVLVLAALIPWNALFISTYTLQSLKKQSPGELRQLFHKYPRLFEATYRSSIRDDPEIVYQAIVSAPWNYQFISERLRSDANFALRSIEANPDVIEHFSSTIRNHPSIAELMDRREFVLEVIDPEDADSGRYDWSGCLNKDSRRLKYLPEHWRSDKEVMLLAIDIALGKCGSVSDGGEYDSMFLSGLDDLFSLIPEALLQDPIFLQKVEERMIEGVRDVIVYYMGNFSEDEIKEYLFLDGIPSMDTLEGLHESADRFLENFSDLPEAENYSNPIPTRLLTALSDAREEIDALAAEKEQQRLRKTLVDELSNLRNSKTADDDKG